MKMTTATKRVFRAYLCGGFAMLSACGGVVTNPPSSTSAGSGGSGGGDSGSGGNGGSGGSPVVSAECAPEGNTPDAMALCDSAEIATPDVLAFCAEHHGCHTELCSIADGPPTGCIKGGKLDGSLMFVWCCAARCDTDADCPSEGTECADDGFCG